MNRFVKFVTEKRLYRRSTQALFTCIVLMLLFAKYDWCKGSTYLWQGLYRSVFVSFVITVVLSFFIDQGYNQFLYYEKFWSVRLGKFLGRSFPKGVLFVNKLIKRQNK